MWIKSVLLVLLAIIVVAVASLLVIIGVANSGVEPRALGDEDMNYEWMDQLDDGKALNELYIPGTHDTGALYSFLGVAGKCQSYSVEDQLAMGVRFFDIRLQLRDNELAVVHSFVDQKLSFDEVLEDVSAFLRAHPSEFVIMSIKEDADPENSTVEFNAAVEEKLRSRLADLLSDGTECPKSVGEARGKVHIVSRYRGATLGIPASAGWQDSTSFEIGALYVQDYYAITDVESKLTAMKEAFGIAKEGRYDLTLNFASCYLKDGFPPAHAPTTAKAVNPALLEMIENTEIAPCIFICDFVTPELIEAIIQNNMTK